MFSEKMDQIVVGKTKEPIRNGNKNMNFFVVWFLQCVCERKPETPGNLKIYIYRNICFSLVEDFRRNSIFL